MKIDPRYKVRSVAGEHLLIMQSGQQTNMTRVISLNETALALYHAFSDKEFTLEQVQDHLITTYGIDQELAHKDASSWIAKLQQADVILA